MSSTDEERGGGVPRWRTLQRTPSVQTPIFTVHAVEREHPVRQTRATFWQISPPDWANVLAITPQGELVLVWQYRHGTDALELEIPGGAVDPDEEPLRGAQRELQEETGFTSTAWQKLGEIAVNPAFMTNRCTTWLALDAVQSAAQSFDEHEEIHVEQMPVWAFFEAIDRGEITHGIVVSAAYFLERHLRANHPHLLARP